MQKEKTCLKKKEIQDNVSVEENLYVHCIFYEIRYYV